MERTYYAINETTAKAAQDANSFRDYVAGSATAEYKSYIDRVYDVVEKIAEEKPNLLERATGMAQRYSRKLAEYYNSYYRNEARCPSILISGGGNFPTRKKEKQNSRRKSLQKDWEYLESYAKKISHLLTMEQPILSGDENAIELLEDKLEKLKESQEEMKAANRAIRLKDVEKGNEALRDMGYTDEQIKKLREPDFCGRIGYPDYALQNNNANIHRVEDRIKSLKAAKGKGTQETECEFFNVVENTEIMRLQLFFEGKPEPEVREVLKSNGFRWAPSQNAWQRQLTGNARYALNQVIKKLQEMKEAEV